MSQRPLTRIADAHDTVREIVRLAIRDRVVSEEEEARIWAGFDLVAGLLARLDTIKAAADCLERNGWTEETARWVKRAREADALVTVGWSEEWAALAAD